VIVLDLGLLTLHGIETARQICKLAPESKILFLSQESDRCRELLAMGREAILKTRFVTDMLATV